MIPTEVLCYIFAETCTDDGYTGRALSLVSRHIRSISRRYALQSVALYGSYQLSAFAAYLEQLDPDDRRVRNLYVTDRRRVWMEYRPGQDRDEWVQERKAEDFHIRNPSRRYSSDVIVTILRYAAPTLCTLTLLLFDCYDTKVLAGLFPVMHELALHGSLLDQEVEAGISECPSLRRLHIVQDFTLRTSVSHAVARIAPSLTHLRISRVVSGRLGSGGIVQGLQQFLIMGNSDAEGLQQIGNAQAGFAQSIKRIIIQMSQQELYDSKGALHLLTSPMAYKLKDIAMRDTRNRIFLLKPHVWSPVNDSTGRDTDVDFYMSIKAAWEDRNEGLEGIWEVQRSDILACYGYFAMDPPPYCP